MYCSKCGKECPEGATYCSRCGSKLAGGGLNLQGLENIKAYLPDVSCFNWKLVTAMVLLLIGMFLWTRDFVVIDLWIDTYEITGLDIIGDSGFLKFVINMAHIAAIVFVGYKAVKSELTDSATKPMIAISAGMPILLGTMAIIKVSKLVSENKWVGEVKDYLDIEISSNVWFLLIVYVGVIVLASMYNREMTYRKWNVDRASVIVRTIEGSVANKKKDTSYGSSIEWITIRQGNGMERVLSHDLNDALVINEGERCEIKYVGDMIKEYVVK